MKSKWMIGLLALLSLGLIGSSAEAEIPSFESPDLARGPFSSMRMLLEKTFLKIDVATIDVRVGRREQGELTKLASGRKYSGSLEGELAKAVLRADHALIQLAFLRSVALQRWIDGVRDSLESANRAGLISAAQRKSVSEGLPRWFLALEEDGFHEGDRVLYELRPGVLRTVAVTRDGKLLVDRIDKGQDIPRLVLASYFAPGTDYRTRLLQSLLQSR